MTVSRFVLLLVLAALAVPSGVASAATPTTAAKRLGGGFSATWFETRGGPARFTPRTTDALVRAGFRNVRIRVRADRFRSAKDLRRVNGVVTQARRSGLQVVVTWSNPAAQRRPSVARRAAYVRWWSAAAKALRSQPDSVLFAVLDDPAALATATHRGWTARALRAIRATGGANPGEFEHALLWVLNQSDGEHGLLDIAERAGMPFPAIEEAALALIEAGLLAAV